jgi:hypothetical protein
MYPGSVSLVEKLNRARHNFKPVKKTHTQFRCQCTGQAASGKANATRKQSATRKKPREGERERWKQGEEKVKRGNDHILCYNRLFSSVHTFPITLNTRSTDEFETEIDITHCIIFNRFGANSLLKEEHHFSTEFPESDKKQILRQQALREERLMEAHSLRILTYFMVVKYISLKGLCFDLDEMFLYVFTF